MAEVADKSQLSPEKTGEHAVQKDSNNKQLAKLSLAALGFVFGDIGTSPLYAIRECFHGEYGIAVRPANVLGVLSLMFWALLMIVTFKYLIFVFRADNQGDGMITPAISVLSAVEGIRIITPLFKPDVVPSTLVQNLKHNKIIHSDVAILHFKTENGPAKYN